MKWAALMAVTMLAACAPGRFAASPTEEIVEGNPESYPAFESAARACSFSALRRVSNGIGGSHYLVRLSYPLTEPERCLTRWLDKHPELVRSAH
jgi:hypothetical protein